jgi:hypothetical protein
MSESVTGPQGEGLVETGGGLIDTALLQQDIGLGDVGQEKANAEEQEKGRRETDASRR